MSQMGPPEGSEPLKRATLMRSTVALAAITAGVLIVTVISAFVRLSAGMSYLVAPSALLGILSPLIGYRIHLAFKRRLPAEAGLEEGCRRFFSATILPMAVTEGVAFVGLIAFMLSGRPACLIGVLTHVILAAAIWPTPEKLEHFLER